MKKTLFILIQLSLFVVTPFVFSDTLYVPPSCPPIIKNYDDHSSLTVFCSSGEQLQALPYIYHRLTPSFTIVVDDTLVDSIRWEE